MPPSLDNPPPHFCDYEGSDYRTAFWEGQGREYEDLAERIALRRLLPSSGKRIIDIGGGFGRLVNLFSGYQEVVLLDYSTTQLADARQRLGTQRITYVAANLYRMPFPPCYFDTATMVRVLHHLSDAPLALENVGKILRPTGVLILEYANKRHLKALVRYVLGRQTHSPFDLHPHEFAELNFNFHPRFVEDSLRAAGLEVERQLSVSHLRLTALKRLVPPRTLATLDGWLQQPAAPLKCSPSMFVRASKPMGQSLPPNEALFCCPRCGSDDLRRAAEHLDCPRCGARWAIEGDIYDFREPRP